MTGHVKVSGAYKSFVPKVKVGGSYKTVTDAWVKVGGVYKKWYSAVTLNPSFAWLARTVSGSQSASHVAYGNGTFLMIRALSPWTTSYSTNGGVTWTAGTTSPATAYTGMVFVNGQFIASNGFTKSLRVSTDGINWTTKTWTTTTGIGGHVAYGAGLYAMITENGVWTSTDLVTWTQRNTTANTWVGNYGSNLIHNGTAFYSVAGSKGYYSVDGITWTITNGFPAHDAGVPYRRLASDGVTTWFVAGNKVYKFTSATTYSLVYTLSTVSVLESIEYSAGRLMAVSRSSTTNRSCYSIDGGATWTDIALPGGAYGLACDGTNWISSTSTANTVNYGTN